MRHPDAQLERWEGPLYPDAVDQLLDILAAKGTVDQDALERVFKLRARTFVCLVLNLRTTDEYLWLWGLKFRVAGGYVLLALPGWEDWNKRDGIIADRAPALYHTGVSTKEVMAVLTTAITLLARYST